MVTSMISGDIFQGITPREELSSVHTVLMDLFTLSPLLTWFSRCEKL